MSITPIAGFRPKFSQPRKSRRVMLVFGTRPEAIKLAPVALHLAATTDLLPIIAVTGQHRSMLDQVMSTFQLTSDYDLNVIQPRQSLATLTKHLMASLDDILLNDRPDAIIVQGDTTSTFAAALSGFYHRIPVVHLEAGLRTWDMNQPYPEEMNRVLTSRLATLHLAATAGARDNLIREGISEKSIFITGNTVIDALFWVLEHHVQVSPEIADIYNSAKPLLLVTAHRRESWGEGIKQIAEAVAELATENGNLQVLFPVHRNPAVDETVRPLLEQLPNVRLTAPLTYPDFVLMMKRATIVLTDSGGVQEEAPSLGTPVLIMREKTERPEAVEAGAARLVGTRRPEITCAVRELLRDERAYSSMARARNPYGDGESASRVAASLRHLLYGAKPPSEFVANPLDGSLRRTDVLRQDVEEISV